MLSYYCICSTFLLRNAVYVLLLSLLDRNSSHRVTSYIDNATRQDDRESEQIPSQSKRIP